MPPRPSAPGASGPRPCRAPGRHRRLPAPQAPPCGAAGAGPARCAPRRPGPPAGSSPAAPTSAVGLGWAALICPRLSEHTGCWLRAPAGERPVAPAGDSRGAPPKGGPHTRHLCACLGISTCGLSDGLALGLASPFGVRRYLLFVRFAPPRRSLVLYSFLCFALCCLRERLWSCP